MIVKESFIAPGNPTIVGKEFATVPCGCKVLFGMRTDRQEPSTGATPCCPEHVELMEEFTRRLIASLDEPTDRLAIDVIDEILENLFAERNADVSRPSS